MGDEVKKEERLLDHAIAGGTMGVVGTLAYMPADAVRGRVYNDSVRSFTGNNKVGGAWWGIVREGKMIYNKGGVLGFWRGTGAAMMRTVPSCVAFPIVMERTRKGMGMDYYE